MSESSVGTFLLGVGCQKGGTAWMHRYLESSAQCDPGFRKEYHVWDGLDLASGGPVRGRVAEQARRAGRALEAGEPADADALRRALFYADPEAYFDYFEALLRGDPRARLTADITPSYADLSTERLAFVRDGFARRGVRVVAVYLMRDPVERIWSAVRMDRQRAGEHPPGSAEAYVPVAATRPMYADRTRYDRTIDRLDQVFGPEQVFYGFYERLFEPATLRALCGFLGIDFVAPDLERHVNVSPKTESLPEATVREVAGHFREVYAAVAARFPQVDLAELWPSSRLL
ncbi:MAG: sulfotransferase [Nocardioides sp.]|nr:sulfotransferase [Nocardioides sp.]